jgi:hypothetical protein
MALSIATASREKLERFFRQAAQRTTTDSWLPHYNKYLRNTITRTDRVRTPAARSDSQLGHYIAISSLLHALDGSRYLGRALYCHVIRDSHSARHLAFYAELRAAMSLLASEGVGVFNRRHYVVNNDGKLVQSVDRPTHVYAWEALREWSTDGRAARLLARIIQLNGVPLDDLLQAAFPGASLSSLATFWFKRWGIDLEILAQEKTWRNQSSYRPTELHVDPTRSTAQIIEDVRGLWSPFEPTGSGRLDPLDYHLLRIAFEYQARLTGIRKRDARYSLRASEVAKRAGMTGREAGLLSAFLMRDQAGTSEDLSIIKSAKLRPDKRSGYADPFSMVCRAALLLRLALGSALMVLNGSVSRTVAREWIQGWGFRCQALSTPAIGDVSIVWSELSDSLAALDKEEERANSRNLYAIAPEHLTRLGQCERIALWALLS